MLKVLVVDDEDIIREGIVNRIPNLVSDIDIVGSAEDASSAIELIKIHHPNVVITDIRMPEVDGLQFISIAKTIFSDIRFIIISGYQDFNYAQTAVRLGVEDYLLKPIDNMQLTEILEKLKSTFANEADEEKKSTQFKKKAEFTINYFKTKCLTDLINKDDITTPEGILKHLNSFDITFNQSNFLVVTIIASSFSNIKAFPYKEDIPILKFAVCNIAEEILSSAGQAIAFENALHEKQINVLLNHNNILLSQYITQLCTDLLSAINNFLKLNVTIGIGSSYDSISKISSSFEESINACMQKIVLGDNKVFN